MKDKGIDKQGCIDFYGRLYRACAAEYNLNLEFVSCSIKVLKEFDNI